MNEVELIERAAVRVGMKSLMNHGAASCVYSEGCNGVSQEHLIAFAREIALHCAVALAAPASAHDHEWREHPVLKTMICRYCGIDRPVRPGMQS